MKESKLYYLFCWIQLIDKISSAWENLKAIQFSDEAHYLLMLGQLREYSRKYLYTDAVYRVLFSLIRYTCVHEHTWKHIRIQRIS